MIFGRNGRMGIFELFVLAVGLSMDAFAVSVCKGLSLGKINIKHMLTAGAWFGGFQALMPLIGYFLGTRFAGFVDMYDHWIAFALLAIIGLNMMREAIWGGDEDVDASMGIKTMFLMAVATSIDALAVGVTFAFLDVAIVPAILFIGCVTFVLSAIGVKVGSAFGYRYKNKAEICGGAILVLLGVKILLEGLGVF